MKTQRILAKCFHFVLCFVYLSLKIFTYLKDGNNFNFARIGFGLKGSLTDLFLFF